MGLISPKGWAQTLGLISPKGWAQTLGLISSKVWIIMSKQNYFHSFIFKEKISFTKKLNI